MPTTYETAVAALPGLVGWWKLNEASGTTATDSAGTVGDATYAGSGVTYSQTSLLAGDPTNTSVLLDGTNGRLTRASGAALNFTSTMSMLAWVQPTDVSSDRAVMFKQPFAWGVYNRSPGSWSVEVDPKKAATPNYTGVSNSTHFLVGLVDGLAVSVVVNGVLVKQTAMSTAITTNANSFEIGAWNGSQKFKGYVQHVALCNQAISLTAIRNLYTIGAASVGEQAGLSANVFPFSRQVLAANDARTRVTFTNCSDRPIDLALGATATVGSGVRLQAGGDPWSVSGYTGVVSGIHSGFLGSKLLAIQEEVG